MIFYSHYTVEDGKVIEDKKLLVHTRQVTQKALHHLDNVPALSFSINAQKLRFLVENIGLYHDLGKYTTFFQNYMVNGETKNPHLKQHAKFGSYALFEKILRGGDEYAALLALYVIVHHHKSLTYFKDLQNLTDENNEAGGGLCNQEIFHAQKKTLITHLNQISAEMGEPQLADFIKFPKANTFFKGVDNVVKSKNIENFFLINYLFSLLIEADKLDASNTAVYQRLVISADKVEERLKIMREISLKKGISLEDYEVKQALRTEVRQKVNLRLHEIDLNNNRLFTLTAPTGVGKTLTALDFALKLKSLVPELEKAQIIYALPFVNIIEQGFDEYQKVFGDSAKIFAHYQYADVFGEDDKNKDNDIEVHYNNKKMELDTWQADIVITSFVQFFQTLIGYRNKVLKKFNHLAGSIIILDEVQTLRLEQLPLIGAALHYLTKYMNARVILMTATKPQMMDLAFKHILENEGEERPQAFELLDTHENIYAQYKRTKIVPLLAIKFEKGEETNMFVKEAFLKNWSSNESCLIVVNKVNRCIDVFDAIKKHFITEGVVNPIYCLSTNILPAHRFERIAQIKADLDDGKKPILIATQVVEAGVDLNFDKGFRDLGPIDSIVQVAGRVNREANPINPERPHLPIFITDMGDCQSIYKELTTRQARKALEGKDEIFEADYLKLVETYFDATGEVASFKKDSIDIFEAMKSLRYDGDNPKQETYVSSFEIIQFQSNVVSVFVDLESGREAKEAFKKMLFLKNPKAKQKAKEAFDKDHKRDFHQHIIAVPKQFVEGILDEKQKLIDKIWLAPQSHYDFETGFIRKTITQIEKKYNESL
jgi:CRISPR-associated endonuclease/helicase Cas3